VELADLCVLRKHLREPHQEIFWVYRLPVPDMGDADFGSTGEMDPVELEEAKAERASMYAPEYMVFRRTAKTVVPVATPDILPELPKPTTQPSTPRR